MTVARDYQLKAERLYVEAINAGFRRILLSLPTGAGKTFIAQMIASRYLQEGLRACLYTHRKILLDQLSESFLNAGIYHGIRAAGYPDERDHRFQICSIQTEHSRSIRRKRRYLHDARLVIVDEAHLLASDMASTILATHRDSGAHIVGFTATPLGLADQYDTLIQPVTNSELFRQAALVPAHHYAPDEPDLETIKGLREGEDLTEEQNRSAIMRPGLFGRIWENFNKINPEHKPSICFAPGVKESIWISEQFCNRGVRAAHIDGENIWLDGQLYPATKELRQKVLDESQKGEVRVLCNRFVLREGIDCPWLGHGILACVFGSLQSYLQSVGRLLRPYHALESVTIQDHGGNYWRHGSANEDRTWELGDTDAGCYRRRAEALRGSREKEPFRCPRCNRVWASGRRCNPAQGGCGHELPEVGKRTRAVVTQEGELKLVESPCFKPRREYIAQDGMEKWKRMYYRAKSKGWNASFRQAMACFAHENYGQWPDTSWPFMPSDPKNLDRKVSEVHVNDLIKEPPHDEGRIRA